MLDQAASTKIIEYCKLKKYPWKEFNIVYLEGVNINGVLNSDAPDMFNDVRAVLILPVVLIVGRPRQSLADGIRIFR
jgi:hypothetical protein